MHICQDQLWSCIVWVMWRYSQASLDTQAKRPQRPFKQGDGARIAVIIRDIRHEYWMCKSANVTTNFASIKRKMLDEIAHDPATRNFYSSVISTYITWSKSSTPEDAKNQLPDLEAFVRHLRLGD